jgi:hypothetical protein
LIYQAVIREENIKKFLMKCPRLFVGNLWRSVDQVGSHKRVTTGIEERIGEISSQRPL